MSKPKSTESRKNPKEETYWQFVEHRSAQPLLPPGVGWMQGTAGIAAFLFRVSRVLAHGAGADAVARMDNWLAVEP